MFGIETGISPTNKNQKTTEQRSLDIPGIKYQKQLRYKFRHGKIKLFTLSQYRNRNTSMNEKMEVLVYEVFIQEERRQAELRLTEAEVSCLKSDFSVCCRPISDQDSTGKRWYLAEIL